VQNLSASASAYSGMLFYDQNGALGQFQGFNNSTHEYRINNIASGGSINFMIGGSSKFLVANTGSVGIGVQFPSARLDVAGDANLAGGLRIRGDAALFVPATVDSVAVGKAALSSNTTGGDNTAVGAWALQSDTDGSENTAVGSNALISNTTGSGNTALGGFALQVNTSGGANTALGSGALSVNTTGTFNLAIGTNALISNTTGSGNIAIGSGSAFRVNPDNSNNIEIGSLGLAGDSGVIRLGASPAQTSFFAAGIRGVATGVNNAVPVVIDSNGQLGTVNSSRRFKEDIHDMGGASRALMRLRPVTFRYRKPFDDGSKPIQFGLIAEEVADVYPDLVARSADGQIETVKYQVLDSMLLNEVQRQQAELLNQREHILKLEQQNDDLQRRLAEIESASNVRR
jgi:hypothetical protein